jgi:hypothetical protein
VLKRQRITQRDWSDPDSWSTTAGESRWLADTWLSVERMAVLPMQLIAGHSDRSGLVAGWATARLPVRPSGIVTFLFTDVEGSTRRWEADADAMRAALAVHDRNLCSPWPTEQSMRRSCRNRGRADWARSRSGPTSRSAAFSDDSDTYPHRPTLLQVRCGGPPLKVLRRLGRVSKPDRHSQLGTSQKLTQNETFLNRRSATY